MHILAVEDQQIDRFLIRKQLSDDFRVTTLSSEREAIAFARTNKFDIALLNVMLMEDMDCIQLLNRLKAVQSDKFTAFVTTCHIDDRRRREILSSGFEAVIQKPINILHFKSLLRVTLFPPNLVSNSSDWNYHIAHSSVIVN